MRNLIFVTLNFENQQINHIAVAHDTKQCLYIMKILGGIIILGGLGLAYWLFESCDQHVLGIVVTVGALILGGKIAAN